MTSEISKPQHSIHLTNFQNTYLLLRHGETEYNEKNLWTGTTDVALTARGREQAASVTLPLTPQVVISSNLSRAIETAQLVIKTHSIPAKLNTDIRLREKFGGDAEGMTIPEVLKTYKAFSSAWKLDDVMKIAVQSQLPNGESDFDVMQRLQSLINELELELKDNIILLVCHSGVMRAIRLLAQLPKEDIYPGKAIKNCAVEIYSANADLLKDS